MSYVLILAAQAAVDAARAAEMVGPAVQGLTPFQIWGPFGAVVVALGGREGIGYILSRVAARRSNGDPAKGVCPLHDGLVSDIRDIKDDLRMLVKHLLHDNKD